MFAPAKLSEFSWNFNNPWFVRYLENVSIIHTRVICSTTNVDTTCVNSSCITLDIVSATRGAP